MDYAFVHQHRAYTPNQTPVAVSDVAAHNAAVDAAVLAHWQTNPDVFTCYYDFPAERTGQPTPYRGTFWPCNSGARVTTWLGVPLGSIVRAHVYTHNFGGRIVALRVRSTTGVEYAGRASWDWGSVVTLRRVKGRRPPC